jgi:hypothetical protein
MPSSASKKPYHERAIDPWVYTDPRPEPIRSEPRFRSIMRGMGLSQ